MVVVVVVVVVSLWPARASLTLLTIELMVVSRKSCFVFRVYWFECRLTI